MLRGYVGSRPVPLRTHSPEPMRIDAAMPPRTAPAPLGGGPLAFGRFARHHNMVRWGYVPLIARWAWLKLRWRGRLATERPAFGCPGGEFESAAHAAVHPR